MKSNVPVVKPFDMEKIAMSNHKGFCKCGCGQRTKIAQYDNPSRGHKKGQPRNYVAGHNRRKSPLEYTITKTGCWVWQRAINNKGYGIGWGDNGREYAHRIYYKKFIGPIPEGSQIDHKCRNRRCVNPEHLQPVSPAVNVQRGIKAKLTWDDVIIIRQERKKGKLLREIASVFGVHLRTICHIVNNNSWKPERGSP